MTPRLVVLLVRVAPSRQLPQTVGSPEIAPDSGQLTEPLLVKLGAAQFFLRWKKRRALEITVGVHNIFMGPRFRPCTLIKPVIEMLLLSRLFILFTVTTLLELFLLLELAKIMGLGTTLAVVIFTGFLGAWLARLEGLRVLSKLRNDLQASHMPTDTALDGLCVLIAGALLITPGVLTDVLGFGLLMAPVRAPLKIYAQMRFRKWMANQTVHVVTYPPTGFSQAPTDWQRPSPPPHLQNETIIDVTPEHEPE